MSSMFDRPYFVGVGVYFLADVYYLLEDTY